MDDPKAVHAEHSKAMTAEPRFGHAWAMRAAAMTTGSAYLSYAGGLISTALLARMLGPTQYGVYAYFVWLSGLLLSVYNGGFVPTSIRFVSETLGRDLPGQAQAVMGWVRSRHRWAMLAVTAGFVLVTPWLSFPAGRRIALLLMAFAVAGAISKAAFTLLAAFGKGYGRFEVEAATTSLVSIVNVAGVVVLYATHSSLVVCSAFFVVLCLLHFLFAYVLAARAGIRVSKQAVDAQTGGRLWATLRWALLLALLAAFSGSSIETYLLNRNVGSVAVAYFSLAQSLARSGVNLLVVGASATLLPTLAHAYGREAKEGVAKVANRAVGYFHFLGVLVAGLGFFLAAPAIRLLYGLAYLPVIWILQAVIVGRALTVSAGVMQALYVANDQQRGRATILSLTLAVNLGAALVLVPRYGLAGAVVSSVVAAVGDLAIMAGVAIRSFGLRLPIGKLLRISAAGLAAAFPAWLVSQFATTILIEGGSAVIFLMLYLVFSLTLRIWGEEDLQVFEGVAARLPWLVALTRRLARQ